MQASSRWLIIVCFGTLPFSDGVFAKDPLVDVTNVRKVRAALHVGCLTDPRAGEGLIFLARMGEKVFPAYEAILSDPKSKEAGQVFSVLGDVETDRRRFAKYAILHLADVDFGDRLNAVIFLGHIGNAADASPIVALLSDKRGEMVGAAANTLSYIGGPNELVAMDVWLRGVGNCEHDAFSRDAVRYHRDMLKKRLEEDKDLKKRAEKIQHCWKELRVTEWHYPEINRAVWILTAFGNETVAFLKDRVHPVPATTQRHFDQLLADLDSDSFKRREAATLETSLGDMSEAVLEQALAHSQSPETKRRLEAILDALPEWTEKRAELLRQVRAVWVLQQIGTPEAKALLEKIAAGAPSARLTQKAKDALQSLKQLQKK